MNLYDKKSSHCWNRIGISNADILKICLWLQSFDRGIPEMSIVNEVAHGEEYINRF